MAVEGYAKAIAAVADAEGVLGQVEEELFRLRRNLDANPDLTAGLGDPGVPASRRQEMLEELLDGKVSQKSLALVGMVISAGQASQLPAIIDAFLSEAASSRDANLAHVTVASEISAEQRAKLAAALGKATGGNVEVRVTVDPEVLGGVHARIGEKVIDGTVATKLRRFREQTRRG